MTLTMTGALSECLLLSYRTPARSVRPMLPRRGLELITRGPWAFWNVVACRVDKMRPAGLPAWCGISYLHVAYRLSVRSRLATAAPVEGLYFVRSDANSLPISAVGNLATDFRFHNADVRLERDGDATTFSVTGLRDPSADMLLRVLPADVATRGADSLFDSADEAASFLKYRPLGLSVDGYGQAVRFAEVIRDEHKWREKPVHVVDARFNFFRTLGQRELHLEMATRVEPLEYRWRLGRSAAIAEETEATELLATR